MPKPLPPLVPPEVDLRDYRYTPIFRARLFGSKFHATVTDSGWRAGVTLWLKSWDQVPAGTLPPSDIELCRLAELGRDLAAWSAVKDDALHGWRLCIDNRLHHEVVAEGVLEAWENRRKASKKGKAGAAARWHGHSDDDGTGNATAIAQAMPAPMPNDSNRMEGNRIEQEDRDSPDSSVGARSPKARAEKPTSNGHAPPAHKGARWPADQIVPEDWRQAAGMKRAEMSLPAIDLNLAAEKFANYWSAKSGQAATKVDWHKTWINWCLNTENPRNASKPSAHDNWISGAGAALAERAAARRKPDA